MKHTNTKQFNAALQSYLEPIIRDKAGDLGQIIDGNPFAWAVNVAREEVGHEFERNGDQSGLEYWLSGLGMNIAYTYADIIDEAEKMHGEKLTDKETDIIIRNWFPFLSAKILQYAKH